MVTTLVVMGSCIGEGKGCGRRFSLGLLWFIVMGLLNLNSICGCVSVWVGAQHSEL